MNKYHLLAVEHPPEFKKYIRQTLGLEPFEIANTHIVATPLLEVFSVSVNRKHYKTDDSPYNIWGLITILNEDDELVTEIYRRNKNDPDVVDIGGFISLNSPDYAPIVPSSMYKLQVFLMDGVHNLANGTISLSDTTDPSQFDKMRESTVHGEDGHASVKYAAFQAAVVASIEELKVTCSMKCFRQVLGIGATITAHYGDCLDMCIPRLLDDRVLYSSNIFLSKTPIRLSKSKIVVPAHSSLILTLDFFDKSTMEVIDQVTLTLQAFQTGHSWAETKFNSSLFQFHKLDVMVRWRNMHEIVIEKESPSWDEEDEDEEENEVKSGDESPQAPCSHSIQRNPIVKPKGKKMVEVLSVCVGPNNGKALHIHGSIIIQDNQHDISIFERDSHAPEELSFSRLLSLKEPCHSLDGHFFNVTTDLKDEDDRVVSKGGELMWGDRTDDVWFDQPLCSVIRGDHGYYATVYYSIFTNATTAKLSVSFLNAIEFGEPFSVSGKIVGRYGCLKNAEPYEREFYHMTLFSKPIEDCEEPTFFAGSLPSYLKLSKSVVTVPTESSLIVDVDLVVAFRDGDHARYTLTKEFKPHHDDSSSEHQYTCDNLTMTMCVNWGEITCDTKSKEMEAARQMLSSDDESEESEEMEAAHRELAYLFE